MILIVNILEQYQNLMMLREILGLNIKKLRKKQNLSQEQLADLTGLHRTYIGAVERGERNISINNIEKIANALNVPPTQLLECNNGNS